MIGLLFIALMLASCGAAALLGGRDGRIVAALYLSAVVATHYARSAQPLWQGGHLPVFFVDAGLMVGLLAVALNSRRYWTIWFAGLHLLTVVSHAQAWTVGTVGYRAYFVMESVWSPIKLVVLLVGVLMDREHVRERARRNPEVTRS